MKKMFLFLAAASLVSATAFAQDDYDYGEDDYGSSESASASDDGYTDMGSEEKASEEQSSSDVDYKTKRPSRCSRAARALWFSSLKAEE